MNISELKEMKISGLTQMAKEFKIEGAAGMRKQELIFALLQAQIEKNGKSRYIGGYDTPEEAHAAYCIEAEKLHGQFARTA